MHRTTTRRVELYLLEALAVLAFVAAVVAGPVVAHHVGTAAALAGTIAAWTFVITYRKSPWRCYEEGRHLMAFTLVIAVILSHVSVRAATGTRILPLQDEAFRLFVYGSMASLLVWRVRLLAAAQQEE